MTPSVTGIIIFLNGEKYLAEAIESVIGQTYADWELLLCDDGTTDGATAIAKDYARKYPGKICYLEHENHENRGMSATRMLGIRHARGQYVAMLDSDDVWTANKLQEQVAILEEHPEAAMVYGPMRMWYSWTGRPEDRARDFFQGLGVTPDALVPAPHLLQTFLRNCMNHPSGLLTRRSVLEAVGGYESSFRGEYEDVVVQSKIALQYPVYASSTCWYWYRQHEGSCTAATRRNWEEKPARLVYLRRLAEYLSQAGVASGPVFDEVQAQLRPFRNRRAYAARQFVRRAVVRVKGVPKYILPKPLMRRLWAWRWGTPISARQRGL